MNSGLADLQRSGYSVLGPACRMQGGYHFAAGGDSKGSGLAFVTYSHGAEKMTVWPRVVAIVPLSARLPAPACWFARTWKPIALCCRASVFMLRPVP